MIKAIILDIDGVLKGSKEGVNFPTPHAAVIEALKNIKEKGIPIILCTGNYYSSMLSIITSANLHNPHISDNGALISNPLDNIILEKHCLSEETAKNILKEIVHLPYYVEVFTDKMYFVERDRHPDFISLRTKIVQQNPLIAASLVKEVPVSDIIKIEVFINGREGKERIEKLLASFESIETYWTSNPAIGTTEAIVITTKGISKLSATKTIFTHFGISPDEALGVGDAMSDWEFMSACGYIATLENASGELKQMVRTKGEGHYFLAPHVNENGILDVFRYFSL